MPTNFHFGPKSDAFVPKTLLHQLHRLRVPIHDRALLIAQIAQQRRSRRAISKDRILHHRLPRTHRVERSSGSGRSCRCIPCGAWYLSPATGGVARQMRRPDTSRCTPHDLLLHRLGKRAQPSCPAPSRAAPGSRVTAFPPISIVPSDPVKISPSLSSPPSTKFTRRLRLNPSRIIEEPQHHVRNIAPILPETQPARRHAPRRPMRSGDEVRPAEQMHKQIARHAAAIRLPLAPLEKVFRIERNLRRSPQKPRPVACLRSTHPAAPYSSTRPSTNCDPSAPSPCSAGRSRPTPAAPSPSHKPSSSRAGCRSA